MRRREGFCGQDVIENVTVRRKSDSGDERQISARLWVKMIAAELGHRSEIVSVPDAVRMPAACSPALVNPQ